jgi:AraC-like DNA-binding protein
MKLKNLVDLSPQDFIIHTKLKHAKNLLIKGHLSIKEVAYSAGFSNPKYFSTSFKKFYKVTPSGFLNSLKQE